LGKKLKLTFIIVVSILVAVIIAIPFIINESYKTNSGYVTLWGADEVFSFYGSILAFLGTVALGALALWQNKKANDLSKRLIKLEEEKFKMEQQPFVMISDWSAQDRDRLEFIIKPDKLYFDIGQGNADDSICTCLSIKLINTSKSFLMANYSIATVYDNDKEIDIWRNGTSNIYNPKLYLDSGDSGEMVFYTSKEKLLKFRGRTINLELMLENRFGQRYKETVDIIITALNQYSDKNWHISLVVQKYKIGKFVRDTNGNTVLESEDVINDKY